MGKLVLAAHCTRCGYTHLVSLIEETISPEGKIFYLGAYQKCDKFYKCENCGQVLFIEHDNSILATLSVVLK